LGKEADCQVAVSVSLANRSVSVPAGWRLYLPREWATDPVRCARAGVPPEVGFLEKWKIALELSGGPRFLDRLAKWEAGALLGWRACEEVASESCS
jgi:hypothetical protein